MDKPFNMQTNTRLGKAKIVLLMLDVTMTRGEKQMI